MANWEELPQDVIELIAQRLTIDDFLAFGFVCTSWRSAAIKETYKAKSKAPWLVTLVDDQIPRFFSPAGGRIYQLKLPGSQVETLSLPGWILVSNSSREYCIFNPLSCISIKLPAFEELRPKSRHPLSNGMVWPYCGPPRMVKIVLSSSPSLSRSYKVMVAIYWGFGHTRLAFHRSAEDAWTVLSPMTYHRWCIVLQLIYYDGLFVALDTDNKIMTLNERESRMESRLVLNQNFIGCPYLVECLGSLLVVWKLTRDMTTFHFFKAEGTRFRVFKVDLGKGTQEEIKSLGNASLFLNDNPSSSFSVEFNAESCLPGIKPNHVYFTYYGDEEMKSYSMEEGKVGTCYDAASRHHFAARWFQPDF